MTKLSDADLAAEISVLEDLGQTPRVAQGLAFLRELQRLRAMVAKFEAWASRLDDLGGLTGCRAVAAGIRNTIKGLS